MGVGPLMLYTLTAVSPLVIDELGLSDVQYGAISTITFASAAVGAYCLGGPSNRLSARRVMLGIAFGAGVGSVLLAVAQNYLIVIVAAVVSGIAQSLSNPATNRVAATAPARRRGALIGWKQSGVQLAQLVAGLVAPAVAVAAGWRWAAASGAMIALLAGVTAILVPNRTPSKTADPAARDGEHVSVATLTVFTFFMSFGLMTTNAYLPLFAHRELGFSVTVAGLTAAVVGTVGVASRIVAARDSGRGGLRRLTLFVLGGGAALGVGFVMAAQAAGGWLVWVGAAVFGVAALASNAVTMVALVRSVPGDRLSAATGSLVTGMYIGFATGPLVFGFVLNHGARFGLAWLLPLGSFLIAALVGLIRTRARAAGPRRDSIAPRRTTERNLHAHS
ncbi:hypothetical protein ACH46_18520 [Gordonia phthalatica]|uniref:Major facilitator superfamily (MFS) profile domain-containing protein n=2 Tax=Gordonia phthalatica TaxID=1136941 RepID=A0A0N9NMG8_9ACTN|nr:hypothetical protein ACH46_18520 [Gordonia phthalatica]